MSVESDYDLDAFFQPEEFGLIALVGGVPVPGVMDTMADDQRPGATANSSMGSFLVGAADATIQKLQFTCRWSLVASVAVETSLVIESGEFAGTYRIKDIQRDSQICRLMLNKR